MNKIDTTTIKEADKAVNDALNLYETRSNNFNIMKEIFRQVFIKGVEYGKSLNGK